MTPRKAKTKIDRQGQFLFKDLKTKVYKFNHYGSNNVDDSYRSINKGNNKVNQ